MVTITEGTIDNSELYTKSWTPDGVPRAKLILLHGFSDHVNLYNDFGAALATRGIAVHGFDQRGWGRSVHTRADCGRSGPTATVLADIVSFVRPHLEDGTHVPLFILGHSMGGLETAVLMAQPPDSPAARDVVAHVRGWLLEAPLFGFPSGETPGALKVAVGRLAGRLMPHFQVKNPIPPENLSRDPAVVAKLRKDKLCHDTGTLEGLASLLDNVADASAGRLRPGPGVRALWLGHGDADLTTSFAASRAWFDDSAAAVPDKTFNTYEGWYHQLHGDLGCDVYFKDVADWILARAGNEDQDVTKDTAAPTSPPNAPATVVGKL